jgi:hypothetical protein
MTQPIRRLLICLLLFGSLLGCKQTAPTAQTPTSTAASPAETEAGWKTIQGEGVVLSVPPGYEGGNPSTDLDRIETKLKEAGADFSAEIQAIRQNSKAIALLAFDPKGATSQRITSINVTTLEMPQEIELEEFLKLASQQLASGAEVLEQKIIPLNQDRAGRIVAKAKLGQTEVQPLFYLVPDGKKFWVITYSTTADEFDRRLPNFEKSIQSFKVQS